MNKKGLVSLIAGFICIMAALAFLINNILESQQAENASESIIHELNRQMDVANAVVSEDFPTDNPDRIMPEMMVDDLGYIGILSVPELDLELPVLGDFDYDALQITPCLYSGTVYQNNMVIGAHNYDAHFGRIGNLHIGATVIFTDTERHSFQYEVVNAESLKPNQNEELTQKQHENDWNLTMFTCNYSGTERVTIRCALKK